VPNPTNPKPAAITAIAAEKRAESFISHCYSRKLWIKIKEAAKSWVPSLLTVAKSCVGQQNA
jgi:hypothetical protein